MSVKISERSRENSEMWFANQELAVCVDSLRGKGVRGSAQKREVIWRAVSYWTLGPDTGGSGIAGAVSTADWRCLESDRQAYPLDDIGFVRPDGLHSSLLACSVFRCCRVPRPPRFYISSQS
ncbi:uncharacterized protein [Physcomitrium patens]|uniref:uncharacterized protein n=1 Tax=Physcomitrium patens TaxID=3218 RepID=UPI003CCE33B1